MAPVKSSIPNRLYIACPSNKGWLQKATPRPDGAPTIKLHATGTRTDLSKTTVSPGVTTTGDKTTEAVMQKFVDYAKAGKLTLKENHHAAFPLGWSYDGEIIDVPAGTDADGNPTPQSRELYLYYWLDTRNPYNAFILKTMGEGYEAQCSIGMTGMDKPGVYRLGRDDEGGGLARYVMDGEPDHVAFTPPGGAAYPYADVEGVHVYKSIASIITHGPTAQETAMQKEELKSKLAASSEARKARAEKAKSADYKKDDVMTACKGASEHIALCKEMLAQPGGTPEDDAAMDAAILDELAYIEQVLNEHVEATGAGVDGGDNKGSADPSLTSANKDEMATAALKAGALPLKKPDAAAPDAKPAASAPAAPAGEGNQPPEMKKYMAAKAEFEACQKALDDKRKEAEAEAAKYKAQGPDMTPDGAGAPVAASAPTPAPVAGKSIDPADNKPEPAKAGKPEVNPADASGGLNKSLESNTLLKSLQDQLTTMTAELNKIKGTVNMTNAPDRFMTKAADGGTNIPKDDAELYRGLGPQDKENISRAAGHNILMELGAAFMKGRRGGRPGSSGNAR